MRKVRLLLLMTFVTLTVGQGCGGRDGLDPAPPEDPGNTAAQVPSPGANGSGAAGAGVTGAAGANVTGAAGANVTGAAGAGGSGSSPTGAAGFPADACPCRWGGETVACPVGDGTSVSALIGSRGGTLSMSTGTEGVTLELDIPEGALAASTKITITELEIPAPAGYSTASLLYRISPVGLALTMPARLRLPWDLDHTQGAVQSFPPTLAIYVSESPATPSNGGTPAAPEAPFTPRPDSILNAGFSQASLDRLGFVFVGSARNCE